MTTGSTPLKRRYVLFAFLAACIFTGQILATTAWTADLANTGPQIAIVKLMNDENVNWAMDDLLYRLNQFITDDIWFKDRITIYETDDPSVALDFTGQIVIYVSHGGPEHIVTGDHLTTWEDMAKIVEASPAVFHQFAACFSTKIIDYGSDDADKHVYAVVGQRPAQVINIDIVSNVLLASGYSEKYVENYRTSELTSAKHAMSDGEKPYILSFNLVTLDCYTEAQTEFGGAVEGIEGEYWWDIDVLNLASTPLDIRLRTSYYWGAYLNQYGEPIVRQLLTAYITYNKTYTNYTIWGVIGNPRFVSGNYGGFITIDQLGIVYVTAGGTTEGGVDWMNLDHNGVGHTNVYLEKKDGDWVPTINRHLGTTGDIFADCCTYPIYDYDSMWPAMPGGGYTSSSGNLETEGTSYTIDSIPTGTGYHGPSFVRPLPFAFKLVDLGCFKIDLGLLHEGTSSRVGLTSVSIYDSNEKVALSFLVTDAWSGSMKEVFYIRYYAADGSCQDVDSTDITGDYIFGDANVTMQMFYDADQGLRGSMFESDGWCFYSKYDLDLEREMKYIAIQSYRYGSDLEHHEVIANISLSCVDSEYSVFYWDCQTTNGWVQEGTDTDFESIYQLHDSGELHSTDGYLYVDSISLGAGWKWGPLFVQKLPMTTSISNVLQFTADIEFAYSNYYAMGDLAVILYDEDKEAMSRFDLYDSYYSTTTRRYLNYYKSPSEGGGSDEWFESTPSGSWRALYSLWYDQSTGSLMSKVDDGSPQTHTHYTIGNFDPTRIVKYVAFQVTSCRTYAENGQALRIHSMTLECAPYRNAWYDGCDSTDGWIKYGPGSGFASARELHDSGTLYSTDGYLYADGISTGSSWKWGPLYVKEIPGGTTVKDIEMFEAQFVFYYRYGRMGDVIISLFDEKKEQVISFTAYDSWYSTTTRRYLTYIKSSDEGGGSNEWLEASCSTSWTATFKFWYDPYSAAVKSQVDDGSPLTHTHYDGCSFNRDRAVRYIGIQFARASTYAYQGSDLKINYVKLTYDRLLQNVEDSCDSVDGWVQETDWPSLFWSTASGTLQTTNGYLYASGLSTYYAGPFWYKTLERPQPIERFDQFTVNLAGTIDSSRGAFAIYVFDENEERIFTVKVDDPYTTSDGSVYVSYYTEDGSPITSEETDPGHIWDETMRFYKTDTDQIKVEFFGNSPVTLLDTDDWQVESSRVIKYIGIQWYWRGTPDNNIHVQDIFLGFRFRDYDGGGGYTPIDKYEPMSVGGGVNEPKPPSVDTLPPLVIQWTLDGGWWPVCLISFTISVTATLSATITVGADLLLQFSLRNLAINLMEGEFTQAEAQAASSESEEVLTTVVKEYGFQLLAIIWGLSVHFLKIQACVGNIGGVIAVGLATVALWISVLLMLDWKTRDTLSQTNEPGTLKASKYAIIVSAAGIGLLLGYLMYGLYTIGKNLGTALQNPSPQIFNGEAIGGTELTHASNIKDAREIYVIWWVLMMAILFAFIAIGYSYCLTN